MNEKETITTQAQTQAEPQPKEWVKPTFERTNLKEAMATFKVSSTPNEYGIYS